MKFDHYSHAEYLWDKERWPNFTLEELSCPHCGEYAHDADFLDRLQRVRDNVGPINLNSAHRCRRHNANVGGALNSQHKQLAVDITLRGQDPKALRAAAVEAGFRGYGMYNTFLHLDMGRGHKNLRAWPIQSKRNAQWL